MKTTDFGVKNQKVMFVIRRDGSGIELGRGWDFYIDGEWQRLLLNGRTESLEIPEGEHEFVVKGEIVRGVKSPSAPLRIIITDDETLCMLAQKKLWPSVLFNCAIIVALIIGIIPILFAAGHTGNPHNSVYGLMIFAFIVALSATWAIFYGSRPNSIFTLKIDDSDNCH
jgi:hypothetical protein